MATAGEEILNTIRTHRCGIVGAEKANEWPEFKALVARIKAAEVNCEAEQEDDMAIEDELRSLLKSSAAGGMMPMSVTRVESIIAELEFLRSLSSAVSQGDSHADLKRRQGPQQVTE